MKLRHKLAILAIITLPFGCAETKQDYCKFLTLQEAQVFDPSISKAEMRQTKKINYCVYKSSTSDKMFISVDRALSYPAREFFAVLAKNSPEKFDEIVSLPATGNETTALFLGNQDDQLKLDFLITQNSQYSVTIRAHDVTRTSSDKIDKLTAVASLVLSRL